MGGKKNVMSALKKRKTSARLLEIVLMLADLRLMDENITFVQQDSRKQAAESRIGFNITKNGGESNGNHAVLQDFLRSRITSPSVSPGCEGVVRREYGLLPARASVHHDCGAVASTPA